MKKLLIAAAACIAMPGIAHAAEPPAPPEKCCCEKMKEAGKDGRADMHGAEHEMHDGHAKDAPKS